MKKVLLQQAFVLHRRSYRESSLLIELFTLDHGRLSLIAKGVRQARSSNTGLLQPFVPLLVSFVGKGELMTLTHVEPCGAITPLQKEALFAGLYLNELMIGLLQRWDAHPRLFNIYQQTLSNLDSEPALKEKNLRRFELYLLEEMGYGLLPTSTIALENAYSPDAYYHYVPERGFTLYENQTFTAPLPANVFLGKSLLHIASDYWEDEQSLRDAKRLMRMALSVLLGAKQVHSRKLFLGQKRETYNET